MSCSVYTISQYFHLERHLELSGEKKKNKSSCFPINRILICSLCSIVCLWHISRLFKCSLMLCAKKGGIKTFVQHKNLKQRNTNLQQEELLQSVGHRQLAFEHSVIIKLFRDDTVCTFKAFEVKQCSYLHQSRLCPWLSLG